MLSTDDDYDPLIEERLSEGGSIPRNPRNSNPMILPRGGAELVEYTRASALADYLAKDIWQLSLWQQLYLAQALGRNPDLAAEAAVHYYSTGPLTGTPPETRQAEKAALVDIINRALERERIYEAANAGTAVHKATEPGAPTSPLPEKLARAVEEYNRLCAGLERVASEVFVVCDELRAAGTFDSGYIDPRFPTMVIIGDTKTGKRVHIGPFEVQMAVYSRGEVYQPDGGRLTFEEFFGLPVSQDVGYLVHIPLDGTPKPRIIELDLRRGWHYAKSAARTRDDRDALDKIGMGPKVNTVEIAEAALTKAINKVETVEEGRELFKRFRHIWTSDHTTLVKARVG